MNLKVGLLAALLSGDRDEEMAKSSQERELMPGLEFCDCVTIAM